MDDPDKRLFINPDVCEGCGDCSVQSNCISITPLETEFGRKRKIDQSTCNKDYSCVKGFCPSFVTVEGASIATHIKTDEEQLAALLAQLPEPAVVPLDESGYNILVGGIGGTGVLTIGALLGMASHLDGKGCTVLDMTGMAQKGGAVTSHIRIGPTPKGIYTSRLTEGMSDLILACDMIVGSGAPVLKTVAPGKTVAILNTDVAPTGDFQSNKYLDLGEARLRAAILQALNGGAAFELPASKLATDLTGDSIGTNVLMMGYAAQKGLLPVSVASIQEAIRLNGTFVKGNLRTFALGRLAAHDPAALAKLLDDTPELPALDTVDEVLASRTRLLTAYQNESYASGYRSYIESVRQKVAAKGMGEKGEEFVRQTALTLAKLMSYKDEYEVARLYTDPKFMQRIREQFSGDFRLSFNLAPPILPGLDLATGRPKKRNFGPWMMKGFQVLARLKGLRGTPFDIFGYFPERRMERGLITEYRGIIDSTVDQLTASNVDTGIRIAASAREIGGYGPVKDASVERFRAELETLQAALANPTVVVQVVAPPELKLKQL